MFLGRIRLLAFPKCTSSLENRFYVSLTRLSQQLQVVVEVMEFIEFCPTIRTIWSEKSRSHPGAFLIRDTSEYTVVRLYILPIE